MFSQVYKVTTVPESNDQGSWFGWKIEHVGVITSADAYGAAKEFREMVISGRAVPQTPDDEGGPTTDSSKF
jgi:hypothetical protein